MSWDREGSPLSSPGILLIFAAASLVTFFRSSPLLCFQFGRAAVRMASAASENVGSDMAEYLEDRPVVRECCMRKERGGGQGK